MGAKVGIFDADVYGPSLPTMISPEIRVLQMDPETKQITPVEYEGVKGVSFGFAQQGAAAIMGGGAAAILLGSTGPAGATAAAAARLAYKLNYMSLCGLLAGSMTDPPALSFANQIAASACTCS